MPPKVVGFGSVDASARSETHEKQCLSLLPLLHVLHVDAHGPGLVQGLSHAAFCQPALILSAITTMARRSDSGAMARRGGALLLRCCCAAAEGRGKGVCN